MTAWGFVHTFNTRRLQHERARVLPGWGGAHSLAAALTTLRSADLVALRALLAVSRPRLAACGGDPADRDWRTFRPLRLSREEDWSDWLAQLIEDSSGTAVAHLLLGSAAVGTVERELSVVDGAGEKGRRADLVASIGPSAWGHVEVKVGDTDVGKTHDTARKLESTRPGSWMHVLLLPDDDAWLWTPSLAAAMPSVRVVLWSAVAIALRQDLAHRTQGVTWLAFARAFCGAIEQTLLDCPTAAEVERNEPRESGVFLNILRHSAPSEAT